MRAELLHGLSDAGELLKLPSGYQPHIHNELKNIAEKARKEAVGLSTEDRDDGFGVRQ